MSSFTKFIFLFCTIFLATNSSFANAELLSLFEPHVYYDNQLLTNGQPAITPKTIKWQVRRGETTLGVVTLRANNENSVSVFLNPSFTGTFKFGVKTKSATVKSLSPQTPTITKDKTRLFYPYDWTQTHLANSVKNVEMIMPGVIADKNVIVHHANSLFEILVNQNTDNTKDVIFFKQNEVNSGWDRTSQNISLQSNEWARIDLLIGKSVKEVQKLSQQTELNPISGHMTQLAFQGWGSTEKGFYPERSDLELVAKKYAGSGIKHVILRLNEPQPEIAEIFSAYGIKPHFYIFLGVARKRLSARNSSCYSLMIDGRLTCVTSRLAKDSTNRIYTPTNKAWAFLELRDSENRNLLKAIAIQAIKNGYAGIFFDGPQIWVGDDGRVGGKQNGARSSWYSARASLLAEIKTATRAIDPRSHIGILGNDYIDYQAQADYMVKEIVKWKDYTEDPTTRVAVYDANHLKSIKDDFSYYVPRFYLGAKGNSGSGVAFMHASAAEQGTPGLPYIEVGDFKPQYLLEYAEIIKKISQSLL